MCCSVLQCVAMCYSADVHLFELDGVDEQFRLSCINLSLTCVPSHMYVCVLHVRVRDVCVCACYMCVCVTCVCVCVTCACA